MALLLGLEPIVRFLFEDVSASLPVLFHELIPIVDTFFPGYNVDPGFIPVCPQVSLVKRIRGQGYIQLGDVLAVALRIRLETKNVLPYRCFVEVDFVTCLLYGESAP